MNQSPGYRIVKEIYRDVNQVVYRGQLEQTGERVIVKTLRATYPTLREIAELERDFEISRTLDHEGVVKALALETSGRGHALILEDFGGEFLNQILTSQPMDLTAFFNIAIPLLKTLYALHRNGIIHKDIHPGNILVNRETKQIKITNFGIASRLSQENPAFTSADRLEGTLAYMSPEQTGRMNRSVDYRTDLYSLGVTLYELLVGQRPFYSTDPLELIHCHIARMPVAPHEKEQKIPKPISDIVMKLLSKTAEDRYQSARGVLSDLEMCQNRLLKHREIEPFVPGQHDQYDRFQIPQKLYGREGEIEMLMSTFDRVSQGTTEMVLVGGYAGVGKSALVNEIHKPIVNKRGYFVSGKFDQFKRDIPYASLIQAFKELIQQILTEDETQLNNWKADLVHALEPNGQILVDVIPELEAVIGKQLPVRKLGPTETQNRFNLVFQKFVGIFTQRQHPLVIFLDDLQWADSGSLKLVQNLVTDPKSGYLLLIGAYRDQEVQKTHPLMLTLDEIRASNIPIHPISLPPLAQTHVTDLISDTLHITPSSVDALAQLVFQKTNGNPFFIRQFMMTLYEEGLLVFEPDAGSWKWELDEIKKKEITENVVELMAKKLQRLPEDTREALKIAACIGNRFELRILCLVQRQSQIQTAESLWQAVEEGLLLPMDDAYKLLRISSDGDAPQVVYKFSHDRIQQAAYSLISETDRQMIHLEIGRRIFRDIHEDELEDQIFDIANQMNAGLGGLSDQSERLELARLNLIAGQKAKASTAYGPALIYLKSGTSLLSDSAWSTQYTLTLDLYIEQSECEYLVGNFETAEDLFTQILKNARTDLDRVRVYSIWVLLHTHLNRQEEALTLGLKGLRLAGVNLAAKPGTITILTELLKIKWKLRNKTPRELRNLPEMIETQSEMVLNLAWKLRYVFYHSGAELNLLANLKMVHLTLKSGNAAASSFFYQAYGTCLGELFGDYQAHYDFGELGIRISEKFNDDVYKGSCAGLMGSVINHWKKHARLNIEYLKRAKRLAIESGDFLTTAFMDGAHTQAAVILGTQLDAVYEQAQDHLDFANRIQFEDMAHVHLLTQRMVRTLKGLASDPSSFGEVYFDEAPYLAQLENLKEPPKSWKAWYAIIKLQVLYLFQNYAKALQTAALARKERHAMRGQLMCPEFYYYDSLTLTASFENASAKEKRRYWKTLKRNQKKMKKWSDHCPENFHHKYLLVAAEMARISNHERKSMQMYELAIQSAQENAYIQNEALANELAAKFHLVRGREKVARTYLLEARYGYLKWGATGKVKDLEERYPALLIESVQERTPEKGRGGATTRKSDAGVLDVTSVMKASQVLSGEIVLDRLLNRMMAIVIENAGAQKGMLILEAEGCLVVEAVAEVDQAEVILSGSIPIERRSDLSEAIVRYVARTREQVVLDDATQEGMFAEDPYVIQNHPKSILCTPIVHQGNLTGILYLENNLTTGAFTSDRLEILSLLSSQAAISLENARLYKNLEEAHIQLEGYSKTLEQRVEERMEEIRKKNLALEETNVNLQQKTEDLEAANRTIQEQTERKSRFLSAISHELRTPLTAIKGSADNLIEGIAGAITDHQMRSVSRIERNSEHMLHLVNDLLDLARIEAGRMEIHPEPFSVKDALIACCETVEPLVKPGVELTHDIAENIEQAHTDQGRIRQIVLNLLSNACKFTEEGCIAVRASKCDSDTLIIAVSDTGKGIPKDDLGLIFEEFKQVKGSDPQHTGTGLGLPITRGFARLLGGAVCAQSEVGKGTTFTVEIPMVYREQ